jgi:gliding motility-associated-like protein
VVTIGDVYPPDPIEIENKEAPKNPDISTDPLFSPNNDGSGNDVFNIVNIVSFPDNEVVIFNRWGNEVFRVKGYNESDRVFKGYANTGLLSNFNTPLVDGVYYYLITTRRTLNGNPVTALNKGYLILKR